MTETQNLREEAERLLAAADRLIDQGRDRAAVVKTQEARRLLRQAEAQEVAR